MAHRRWAIHCSSSKNCHILRIFWCVIHAVNCTQFCILTCITNLTNISKVHSSYESQARAQFHSFPLCCHWSLQEEPSMFVKRIHISGSTITNLDSQSITSSNSRWLWSIWLHKPQKWPSFNPSVRLNSHRGNSQFLWIEKNSELRILNSNFEHTRKFEHTLSCSFVHLPGLKIA